MTILAATDADLPSEVCPAAGSADQAPLTEEEIAQHSRIKCNVCGEFIQPDEVEEHSRFCVLELAPHLRQGVDKWCIASASMTLAEQREFVKMRRTEELARVEEIEAELLQRMPQLWWMDGRFGYIISSKWLRGWRSFVGVGRPSPEVRDRPPRPVNNGDLFQMDGSLRDDLKEGVHEDYTMIEQTMWEFFCQVYGGGPPILRYNASGVLPALSDAQACFEGEWKDGRPDTGHGKVFDPYSGCGFNGELKGGFLHDCTGKGLLCSGSHYEGTVVQGLPDGKGREVKPDGTVLEGCFVRGKLHGHGWMTDPEGLVEEGEWEDGVLSGI